MDGNTIHFVAGAAGGTVGAVVTCPLEVIKTRLQSSRINLLSDRTPNLAFQRLHHHLIKPQNLSTKGYNLQGISQLFMTAGADTGILISEAQPYSSAILLKPKLGLISCLRNIVVSEGPSALFKGLLPNLVGVAPSRAIYFSMYAKTKCFLNDCQSFNADTPLIHLLAAACAGSSSATVTSPLWVIKTRVQLNGNKVSTLHCAKELYLSGGIKAFYKGITASYYGLAETAIHLVIYEEIKRLLASSRVSNQGLDELEFEEMSVSPNEPGPIRLFIEYMGAGAISKTIATSFAYPHEVARTRMREEGNKYQAFWQTLGRVYREDGFRGLYRGLGIQMVRQIPNTAIMMATYEAVVYFFTK